MATRSDLDSRLALFGPTRVHVLNEYCTREVATKVIRPGSVVFDLGANEGFHTRHFSDAVGPSGKVHAFEPNPSMWEGLLKISSVRLWPVAVGDVISVESFFLPTRPEHHQVGSLVDPRDFMGDVGVQILTVPQVTLDSLVEISDLAPVFIKADVERREFQAFLGARQLLSRHQPIVVFENNTAQIQEFFESLDYNIFPIANALKSDFLANSVALPKAYHNEKTSVILTDDELEKLLTWVEQQYPDDVLVA